nr:glycosyltransferase family 2 protein [Bacilli bacterium]
MKFSIVIPVYNVEKYIAKCLDSIKSQTYANYEVIIVNDGTKDNSVDVINKYLSDPRFALYNKKNGGLSDARNYGIKYVTGDYIIFIDSDDYIEPDLLNNLNNILKENEYDIIKYKINMVDDKGALIRKEVSDLVEGKIDLKEILSFEYSEPAWAYAYNKDFFIKNKFMYPKGRIHEDFGLTPYILVKANSIYYMDYYGYNYVQRENSIVNGSEKARRRCEDMLYHFDSLYILISNDNTISEENKKLIYSYLANGVILKGNILDKTNLKWYIKEIKSRDITKYLASDTLIRKMKKLFIKLNISAYIKSTTR